MKPSDYMKMALALDTNYPTINERLHDNVKALRLMHGSLGLAGESGEVVDLIKKHLIFGKPLDELKLKNEIGDTFWYITILLDAIGSSFEEVMQLNVDKLAKRYPNGFTEQAAIERRDIITTPMSETTYELVQPKLGATRILNNEIWVAKLITSRLYGYDVVWEKL